MPISWIDHPLPGNGYAEICRDLQLPPDAPVRDVLAAIFNLKEAHRKRQYRRSQDHDDSARN